MHSSIRLCRAFSFADSCEKVDSLLAIRSCTDDLGGVVTTFASLENTRVYMCQR